MKRISIAIAALFAVALCCVSFAYGKDVKVSRADNDKIVNCSVGDVLRVRFDKSADRVYQDSAGILVPDNPYVQGHLGRGFSTYNFKVAKAGSIDLKLQRCYGSYCHSILVHVVAVEAKK